MLQFLKNKGFFRIVAVLTVALLISLVIQYWFTKSELNRIQSQFETQTASAFDQIHRKFKETQAYLNSLIAFRKLDRNLTHYSSSSYIVELLKLFPHIRQVSVIRVSEQINPQKASGSQIRIRYVSELVNANRPEFGEAIKKSVGAQVIKKLIASKESMSMPFDYLGRPTLIVIRSMRRPNDLYLAGNHYIVLYIDVNQLFNPILKQLKPNEAFSVLMDGKLLLERKAKRKSNKNYIVSRFTHQRHMVSHSRVFSLNYYRNLAQDIAPINRFLMVFTIVLAIFAVFIILWAVIVNSKYARSKAQKAAHKNRSTAVATMESVEEAVVIIDAHGNVEHINPVAERLLNVRLKQAHQKPLLPIFDLRDLNDEPVLDRMLFYSLERKQGISIPHKATLCNKGKSIPIAGSFTPLLNAEGMSDGAVIVFRDLIESIKMNEKLRYLATHDDTTELINRREFMNRLQDALNRAKEENLVSVLIYLDLDQFKVVNDSCGHLVGDELLAKIARLLENNIRLTDTIGRLGGDEFAILLEDCTLSDAEIIAGKLNEAVKNYHFKWQKKVFDIAASLGIVEISSNRYSVSELLSLADAACYLAKQYGRNRYHVYSADDDAMIQHRREIQWVQRIRQAYEENRFRLFLQEIRPLSSVISQHKHFEILLRMLDDDDKVILPMSYILAAERYDKMAELDAWVIKNAFEQIAQYIAIEYYASFAINLSGQSLGNSEILDLINQQLDQSPQLCQHIIFEITETAAISNPAQAAKFVSLLKRKGVRFALDDFGTGLSSFAYLKNLNVDYLKIDGQFIRGISQDRVNYALVEAINKIGHVMGIKTVAEYVENEAIKETLQKIGIDYGQGLWFSRPVPMDEMLAQLKSEKESLHV